MNTYYFSRTIFIVTLWVVFFIDWNCRAAKLKPRQSLSQNVKLSKRKKDAGTSLSENKNHFESKMVILCVIGDYEVEFAVRERNHAADSSTSKKPKVRVIRVEDVIMKNTTTNKDDADGSKCRKEIRERKERWISYLRNPPSEKIAKLKARVENKDNQFTIEDFCQAVAILYQRIKDDLDLEVRGLQKSIDNPISKYDRTNFVIPFLLEEYPGEIGKAVKEVIAKELQKSG